jgi:hypothetical protein
LEGGESLIPALDQLITRSSQLGVDEVVLGMAHRGRLNVLTNIFQNHTSRFSQNLKEKNLKKMYSLVMLNITWVLQKNHDCKWRRSKNQPYSESVTS